MSSDAPMPGSYADLAAEYYDPIKHPTSANFRVASRSIIAAWLPTAVEQETACDVGAGDSVLAELWAERGASLSSLVLVDSSEGMLAHSQKWRNAGAQAVVADASAIPYPDGAFGLLVASLGDPYNTRAFWREVRRVVQPGGHIIFTTPSYEWASWFRSRNQEPPDSAEFLISSGRKLQVPSYVLPESDQLASIAAAQCQPVGVYHVLLAALGDDPVSEKLGLDATTPFVSGYLALSR